MKQLALSAVLLALPLWAAPQNRAGGHPAPAGEAPRAAGTMRIPGAITDTGFAGQLGRSIQGQRMGPSRGRTVTPYFFTGPAYAPAPYFYYVGVPVIVNQTFVTPPPPDGAPPPDAASAPPTPDEPPPPVFSGYQAPPEQDDNLPADAQAPRPATPALPSTVLKPTLYLIAMKGGTVQTAVAYWYEGSALNYVSKDHEMHQVSLDDVDRDLSTQLNSERGIDFHFPD